MTSQLADDDPAPSEVAERAAGELGEALRLDDLDRLQEALGLLRGLAEMSGVETDWVLGQLTPEDLRRTFLMALAMNEA